MVNCSKIILSLLAISTQAEAYWRMSYRLIQNSRIDPIDAAPKSNTPITALNGAATYLGCYTDGGSGGRTLPNASFTDSTVTLESCASFCKGKSLPLFGIEHGSECHCGIAPDMEATITADGDCKMKCAGNSSQICGGSSRISIWNQTLIAGKHEDKKTTSHGSLPVYIGCYIEGTTGRALPLASLIDLKMSLELCFKFCTGKGYTYMGLEYAAECYCSNTGPSNGSGKASERECNMRCMGNSNQMCGAANRISVYKELVIGQGPKEDGDGNEDTAEL